MTGGRGFWIVPESLDTRRGSWRGTLSSFLVRFSDESMDGNEGMDVDFFLVYDDDAGDSRRRSWRALGVSRRARVVVVYL